MTSSMTTSSSVRWQDFFSGKPCEHGFARFSEAIEKHGLEAAVRRTPDPDRRWGAEYTHRTDILAILSHDEDVYVRYYVASNPQTPAEMLVTLATDKDYYVREGVASNANTPVEVLGVLAHDEDVYVRYYVARNANTPVEVLGVLAHDEDDDVRSIAQDRLRPTGF
jgi:hypothetical protein